MRLFLCPGFMARQLKKIILNIICDAASKIYLFYIGSSMIIVIHLSHGKHGATLQRKHEGYKMEIAQSNYFMGVGMDIEAIEKACTLACLTCSLEQETELCYSYGDCEEVTANYILVELDLAGFVGYCDDDLLTGLDIMLIEKYDAYKDIELSDVRTVVEYDSEQKDRTVALLELAGFVALDTESHNIIMSRAIN